MAAFAEKVQTVQLKQQDFRTTFSEVTSGDVVYCDPRYVPLNDTSNFTTYSASGFSLSDQEHLAELASKAARTGAVVLVSNHDTPLTRKLYSDAVQVVPVWVQRMISCDGANRKKTQELIAIFC